MNDINIFTKNEKELATLIQAIRIYIKIIEMKFGIEKCATLLIKRGKKETFEVTKLTN